MRRLIYTYAIVLALTASMPADNATARIEGNSHIDGAVQFPQTKWRNVRHTLRVHIPQGSRPLSHLYINVPEGLTASNLTVRDNLGIKVDANISIKSNTVGVDFLQPVAGESTLKIDLNNVIIRGVSNGWLYRVSAKVVGLEADIPIGIAQIRVY